MGNKASAHKKAGGAKKSGLGNVLGQQQGGPALTEAQLSQLEAELRQAQETALTLTAGVDLLQEELLLEQRLAAMDMDGVDEADADVDAGGAEEEDAVELDPDELAELEGELEALEREMLAAVEDGDGDVALGFAASAAATASASAAGVIASAAAAASFVAVEKDEAQPAEEEEHTASGRTGAAGAEGRAQDAAAAVQVPREEEEEGAVEEEDQPAAPMLAG